MRETHVQIFTTRSKSQILALAVLFPLGAVLLWGNWTDVMAHGAETKFLGFFVFGLLFCVCSLFVVYGLVRPWLARGEIDADHIRCFRNDRLKLEIAKADIACVTVTATQTPSSHWVEMNDGRVLKVWRIYFENHHQLREALTAFGYSDAEQKTLRSLLRD